MNLNPRERNQFILDNLKLVYHVTNRYFYKKICGNFDYEDLKGIGTVGLIKAVDGFNPEYGTKFSTYAVPMIYGEIHREIRDHSQGIHVSRLIKDARAAILKNQLENTAIEEISIKLNIPVEIVLEALKLKNITNITSLDQTVNYDNNTPMHEVVCIYEQDFDTSLLLHDMKTMLSEDQYKICKMRIDGANQKDIGKLLGISQTQISRELAKVKSAIRKYLKGECIYLETPFVGKNFSKFTLDLNEFVKFDATNSRLNQGSYIRVTKDKVTISSVVGQNLKINEEVELLINKKGNIIILRKSENGLKIKSQAKHTTSKFIACKAVIRYLLKMDVQLPANFNSEWDDDLHAWVGRRDKA